MGETAPTFSKPQVMPGPPAPDQAEPDHDVVGVGQWLASREFEYPQKFWENPQRVARYYNAVQSAPPDAPFPEWLDREFVTAAYDLFQTKNNGSPWWEWTALEPDDPERGFLQALPPPPKDFRWPGEEVFEEPEPQQNPYQTQEDFWKDLPAWQQVVSGIMSSPYTSAGATMAPFSIIGGIAGAAGGPIGIAAGVLGPQLMGAGLAYAGDPETYKRLVDAGYDPNVVGGLQGIANAALKVLNVPAEWLEKAIGAYTQVAGAELDRMAGIPNSQYGTPQQVLRNLPAAWNAGALTYEAFGAQHPTLSNIPPAIEWLIDWAQTGESDVRFAKRGEVHVLGVAEPVKLDAYGLAAMAGARNEIMRGAPPTQVVEKYQQMFGFSGQFTDLMFQMLADPLNAVPFAERSTVGLYAHLAGNPALEMAARTAGASGDGFIGAMRSYGDTLRAGYGPAVQQMTPFQRWAAGVTPDGVIRELAPKTNLTRAGLSVAEQPFNPFAWAQSLKELTPTSRARALLGLAQENIGTLLDLAGDEPTEMYKLVRAWRDLPPAQAGEVARILGLPEASTVRQALADFTALDELEGAWVMGSQKRELLLKIADLVGETPALVLDQIRAAGDQLDNLHARLRQRILDAGTDAARQLAEHPGFTPAALADVGLYFADNPWHPGHARAILHNTLLEHAAKWSVKAYGVKPDSRFFRFTSSLKSVQSMLLLGVNPAYAVNNLVSNVVTRTAEGVFGFVSSKTIQKFFDDFGIQPSRLRAGIGAADLGLDAEVLRQGGTAEAWRQGGVNAAEAMGLQNAEFVVRSASRATGKLQMFQDVAGRISNVMPITKLAAANERYESANAMYAGVRGWWARQWHRNGVIPRMGADLERALSAIDPRLVDALYTMIEQGMTVKDIDRILTGKLVQRTIDPYIPSAAAEIGVTPGELRETLVQSGAWDVLQDHIEQGAAVTDAFAAAERQVQRSLDQRLQDDLITRAGEAQASIQSEGFVRALDILQDMQLKVEELWTRHYAEWERAFELAYAPGVTAAQRKTIIQERSAAADAEWRAHQRWEEATWLGVLRAMGFGDPSNPNQPSSNALKFGAAVVGLHRTWQDFFKERGEIYKRFFNNSYEDDNARTLAWQKVQDTVAELYQQYILKENRALTAQGELFIRMFSEQFGAGKVAGAAEWWKTVADLTQTRQAIMADFRDWERGRPISELRTPAVAELVTGKDPKNRHNIWPEFLKKVYLPLIGQIIQAGLDGAWRMYQDATGVQGAAPGAPDPVKAYEDARRQRPGQAGQQPTPPTGPSTPPTGPGSGPAQPTQPGPSQPSQPGTPPPGAPPPGTPGQGIPFMITIRMIDQLKALGWRQEDINKMKPAEAWDLINNQTKRELTPEEIAEAKQQKEESKQLVKDVKETNNLGLMGPRHELADRLDIPQVVADRLSEEIEAQAHIMLSDLPAGEDAVVVIPTSEGGYTASQNPPWYIKLYDEYEANGKKLSRASVESALKRIIEDHGKDTIRTNEQTIVDVKRALLAELRGMGSEMLPLYDLEEFSRFGDDIERGRDVFKQWFESSLAADFTDDDWGKLVGSVDRYARYLDDYLSRPPDPTDLTPGAGEFENLPEPVKEAVENFINQEDVNQAVKEFEQNIQPQPVELTPEMQELLAKVEAAIGRMQAIEDKWISEGYTTFDRGPMERMKAYRDRILAGEQLTFRELTPEEMAGIVGAFGAKIRDTTQPINSNKQPLTPEEAAEIGRKQAAEWQKEGLLPGAQGKNDPASAEPEPAPAQPEDPVIEELKKQVRDLERRNKELKFDRRTDLPVYSVDPAEVDAAPYKVGVDVSGLKYLNDHYGNDSGDALLRAFADTTRLLGYKAWRWQSGGDEFIIPFNDRLEAMTAAKELKDAFSQAIIVVRDQDGNEKLYQGFQIYTGIGDTAESAYNGVNDDKARFKEQYPDLPRGALPPTVRTIEQDAAGRQGDSGGAAGDAGVRPDAGADGPGAEEAAARPISAAPEPNENIRVSSRPAAGEGETDAVVLPKRSEPEPTKRIDEFDDVDYRALYDIGFSKKYPAWYMTIHQWREGIEHRILAMSNGRWKYVRPNGSSQIWTGGSRENVIDNQYRQDMESALDDGINVSVEMVQEVIEAGISFTNKYAVLNRGVPDWPNGIQDWLKKQASEQQPATPPAAPAPEPEPAPASFLRAYQANQPGAMRQALIDQFGYAPEMADAELELMRIVAEVWGRRNDEDPKMLWAALENIQGGGDPSVTNELNRLAQLPPAEGLRRRIEISSDYLRTKGYSDATIERVKQGWVNDVKPEHRWGSWELFDAAHEQAYFDRYGELPDFNLRTFDNLAEMGKHSNERMYQTHRKAKQEIQENQEFRNYYYDVDTRTFVLRKLKQENVQGQGARGMYLLLGNGSRVIAAMKNADADTFVHEMGHYYFDFALNDADRQTVMQYAEVPDLEGNNYVKAQEAFANGYVAYRITRDAPSKALRRLWDNLALFLTQAVRRVADLFHVDVTDLVPTLKNKAMDDLFSRLFLMEPWEMTRAEFSQRTATPEDIHPSVVRALNEWNQINHDPASLALLHNSVVFQAMLDGRPVPASVLADYPNMQAAVAERLRAGEPVDIEHAAAFGDVEPRASLDDLEQFYNRLYLKIDMMQPGSKTASNQMLTQQELMRFVDALPENVKHQGLKLLESFRDAQLHFAFGRNSLGKMRSRDELMMIRREMHSQFDDLWKMVVDNYDTQPVKPEPVIEVDLRPRGKQLLDAVEDYLLGGDDFAKSADFEAFAKQFGYDRMNETHLNEMYDIYEGVLNLIARDQRKLMSGKSLAEQITELAKLEKRLPKARRTISKMELQQFSTPLTISEGAMAAADVQSGDVILEPTAGTGNLVDRFVDRTDVQVRVNEIDPVRRQVLEMLEHRNITGIDVLHRDWVIGEDGKLLGALGNVVICNPPWGAYSRGIYGKPVNEPVKMNDWSQRFTHLILRRLPVGGRLVEVAPTNWVYTESRKTREITPNRSEYLKYLEDNYWVRAIIESPDAAYDQRATGVSSLLVVVDKMPKPADAPPALEAWGENRPKDFNEYAALVNQLRGTRTWEAVQNGQKAVRRAGEPEPKRPTTGPDSTGLVDPAARRGEQRGDPADIGRPTDTPNPDDLEWWNSLTPQEREAWINFAEGKIPGKPDTGPDAGRATQPERERSAAGDDGRTAGAGRAVSGDGPDATLPAGGDVSGQTGATADTPGAGRSADTGMVDRERGEVPDRDGKPTYTYSSSFTERINASKAAVANSTSFALYVGRSKLRPGDFPTPHPTAIVETKGLAGVPYPELEEAYRPSAGVMGALNRRVLSLEGNLDPIWAAIQQNDKHNSAIIVADDVGMGKSRTAAGYVLDRLERGKKRILVVTKGTQNVQNLMNSEFPGVYAGTTNENGAWVHIPNEYPAERVRVSGETMPKVKKGQEAIPTFDGPAVYFLSHNEFMYFTDAIKTLAPDAIVIDEAHEFKNVGSTARGTAWADLHKDWLARDANILYLTATPGVDIADLNYLYGLRVWTMDGFGDWIKIVTGKESAESVKQKQNAQDQVQEWIDRLDQTREGYNPTPNTRNVNRWERRDGFDVGQYFVYYDPSFKDFAIIRANDPSDGVLNRQESETEAIIIAGIMEELGPRYYEAGTIFKTRFPAPNVRALGDAGIKDASDIIQASDKGKQWGKAKMTAFEATLPPAHTEQIMRELKQSGHYLSRDISRAGVGFEAKEYAPPSAARAAYNKRVDLYRRIFKAWKTYGAMNEGPKKSAAAFGINGDIQADAKRALFHMRLPGVIEEAKAALARGEQVVISTVSVSEVEGSGSFLENAISKINVMQVKKVGKDSFTDPKEIPEALIEVTEIREAAEELERMGSPVDVLNDVFRDRIALVTGATKVSDRERAVRDFQANKLDVVVISGAGKTGINLHDVTGKRRVHLIVGDFEWSATTFKQELGRVDRTGQATSPKVTVMHTGSAGERKFVATISNRMKGLGATSKGGAESTGTSTLTDEFELGSTLDQIAVSQAWSQLSLDQRQMFLDGYFKDKTLKGDYPIASIPATAEAIKKFLLALQSMYLDDANAIYDVFTKQQEVLAGSDAAADQEAAKTARGQGKIIRETQLNDTLRLTEVENETGDKFGIVNGVLTPEMNRLRNLTTSEYDQLRDTGNSWMRWAQFFDKEQGRYVAGLVIKPGKLKPVAEAYGKQAGGGWKPETALRDLRAGDKIPVIGEGMEEWKLYIGKGGAREGLIVVDGAKMKSRQTLLNNGAVLSGVGMFYYVPEENLPAFFKRFPIRNDPGPAPERPSALYQVAPNGQPQPTPEAERFAAHALPDRVSVMRFPRPFDLAGMRVVGMVFMDGKWVAWVPERFASSREFQTANGPARLLGTDGDGNWVFLTQNDDLVKRSMAGSPDPAAAGPLAMGTLDAVSGVEYDSQTLGEGWANHVRPALDVLEKQMLSGAEGRFAPEGILQEANKLGAAEKRDLRRYLSEVKQEMSKAKLAAVRHGEHKRDLSLLNYSRRYGFDAWTQTVFPYNFWYGRSALNWALRAMDRPGIMSMYAKIKQFQDRQRRLGLPTRLKGKTRMPAAWLPEWAGGGMWVDPIGKLFPFTEFLRPIDRMLQGQSRVQQRAEYNLLRMVQEGEISGEAATQAATEKAGPIWESAYRAAQADESGDGLDMISLFSSPALYLTIPWRLASGQPEKIAPLPISRQIRGLAASTGIDELKLLDIEGKIRNRAGLSEFGEWGDYYIDRQLANMAADGSVPTQEVIRAMIERQGPAFEEAQRRVELEQAFQTVGMGAVYAGRQALEGNAKLPDVAAAMLYGWMPAGLLPDGELKLRGLKTVWDAARNAYNAGDKTALENFFADYPEYEARLSMGQDPEKRLRSFLVGEIWDRWSEMPALHRRQAGEQLGEVFNTQFLEEETRDYDSLDVQTLANWSQTLGGYVPAGTEASGARLNLADEQLTQDYQGYVDQRNERWPQINQLQAQYFGVPEELRPMVLRQYPQLSEYWTWRDTYLAKHPDLIPLMTSEESKLSGAPAGVARLVYEYRAERARLFPNIFGLQEAYSQLESKAAKAAFRRANPQLTDYWDWQDKIFETFPTILPYVKSVESVSDQVLGKDYAARQASPMDLSEFQAPLLRQLTAYYLTGNPLGAGAQAELRRLWEKQGKPGGSLQEWIDSNVKMSLGR